jgi:hypothetical protein
MKKIILALVVMMVCIGAAIASPIGSLSVASGVITGNGNDQTVVNYATTQNAGQISNTQNTASSSSTSTNYQITNEAPAYTYHDHLDLGAIRTETTSLFLGDVLVLPVNDGNIILAGQIVNVTYQSADPLLAYVIDSKDNDAIRAQSNAPTLEDSYGVWNYGNIRVFKTSEDSQHSSRAKQYLSSQAIRTFVAPYTGYYSFVLDTRPSVSRFGNTVNSLSDNTVDITYIVQNDGFMYSPMQRQYVIGVSDPYPTGATGKIINS